MKAFRAFGIEAWYLGNLMVSLLMKTTGIQFRFTWEGESCRFYFTKSQHHVPEVITSKCEIYLSTDFFFQTFKETQTVNHSFFEMFHAFSPPRGGQSNMNGCKGRAQTDWGIQWEHRLKKWGVIGWEHDFWHSVREKYKNMWGHRVRAKISLKSRVFLCKITKVNFSNASFSNHAGLWVTD